MVFIILLFNIILKMILGFNIFSIFILLILTYAKLYTKFSLKLTYNITQRKCFLLWLFNCFYICQVSKIALIINQTDTTFTFKVRILIIVFCIKCLQLLRIKAKFYIYYINLEFCELIRENCDGFLSFILNTLFYDSDLFFIACCVFSYFKNFLTYFQFHICLL